MWPMWLMPMPSSCPSLPVQLVGSLGAKAAQELDAIDSITSAVAEGRTVGNRGSCPKYSLFA